VGRDEPGERARVAAGGDGVVDRARPPPTDVRIERDDRVDERVHRVDARQMGVQQLGGRDLPLADETSLFGRGEVDELGHGPSRYAAMPDSASARRDHPCGREDRACLMDGLSLAGHDVRPVGHDDAAVRAEKGVRRWPCRPA
jgi:hypothetical protein